MCELKILSMTIVNTDLPNHNGSHYHIRQSPLTRSEPDNLTCHATCWLERYLRQSNFHTPNTFSQPMIHPTIGRCFFGHNCAEAVYLSITYQILIPTSAEDSLVPLTFHRTSERRSRFLRCSCPESCSCTSPIASTRTPTRVRRLAMVC